MVAFDLIKITYHWVILNLVIFLLILTLIWPRWFDCINHSSQSGVFLLLLLLILSATVFFLFSLSFCRKLEVIKVRQSRQNWRLWALYLRFFWLRVFYSLRLGVGFDRSSLHWLDALMVVLIGIATNGGYILALALTLVTFLTKILKLFNFWLFSLIYSLINGFKFL